MATRPQRRPTANTNPEYLANQTRPTGRGLREVKENELMQAYLKHISSQTKNRLSAAKRQETLRKNQTGRGTVTASAVSASQAVRRDAPPSTMGLLQDLRDGDLNSPLSQAFMNGEQDVSTRSQAAFQVPQTPRYHFSAAENPQLPCSTSFSANSFNTPYSSGFQPHNPSPSPVMQVSPALTEPTTSAPVKPSLDSQLATETPYEEDPWSTTFSGNRTDEELDASEDDDADGPARRDSRPSVLQVTARRVHLPKSSKSRPKKRQHEVELDKDTVSESDSDSQPKKKRLRNIKKLSRNTKRIIEKAFEIFKAKLTVNPWPQDEEENNNDDEQGEDLDEASMLAIESWIEASEKLYIEEEITEEITKRIRERMAQFRGQLRDCARKEMESTFGFIDVKRLDKPTPERITDVVKANTDIVEAIKDSFWYTDPRDKTVPNSMYYNPIIQKVFNMNWFGEGTYRRGSYFKDATEVSAQTVALILCAVSCVIDEWSTGRRTTCTFNRKTYHARYKKYLDHLAGWQEFTATEERDLAKVFLQGLLRNADAAGELPEEHREIEQSNARAAALEAYRADQA